MSHSMLYTQWPLAPLGNIGYVGMLETGPRWIPQVKTRKAAVQNPVTTIAKAEKSQKLEVLISWWGNTAP